MSCLEVQSQMQIGSCYFRVTRRELAIRCSLHVAGSFHESLGPRILDLGQHCNKSNVTEPVLENPKNKNMLKNLLHCFVPPLTPFQTEIE